MSEASQTDSPVIAVHMIIHLYKTTDDNTQCFTIEGLKLGYFSTLTLCNKDQININARNSLVIVHTAVQ